MKYRHLTPYTGYTYKDYSVSVFSSSEPPPPQKKKKNRERACWKMFVICIDSTEYRLRVDSLDASFLLRENNHRKVETQTQLPFK